MTSNRHLHPLLWGIGRRLALVCLLLLPLWLAVWLVTGFEG